MTLELKSLKSEAVALLEGDEWTIEKLAVAAIRELTAYRGIGKVGAAKAIAEATEILNQQGLEDAETLAIERYYQKAPLAKILTDWEEAGLSIEAVALSSAKALVILKRIEKSLALKLISAAQNIVNKRALYQSRVATPGVEARQINPAFDEKWLSGEVEPPAMAIRVRRNFEKAQREYRTLND